MQPAKNRERAVSRNAPLEVLVPIRWPTGGIRTFIVYNYRRFDPERLRFTIVGPASGLRLLQADLARVPAKFVPTGESTSSFISKVIRETLFGAYDLIHSQGVTAGLVCAWAARLRGLPHVLTAHDVFWLGQFRGIRGSLRHALLRSVHHSLNVFHAIGNDVRDNLLEHFPQAERCVVTIRSGIETEPYLHASPEDLRFAAGVSNSDFLIGFLGRFMSQKGFKELIHAMELLARWPGLPRRPVVLAFGWGGFIREDQALIRALRLDESFHFMPFRQQVAPVLKGLDVVVMPSKWEAMPLLAMESLVAGVPLIASSCIGLREVVAGSPATVIESGSPAQLAEAIASHILESRVSQARLYAAEAARRFDVSCAALRLQELLLDVGNA